MAEKAEGPLFTPFSDLASTVSDLGAALGGKKKSEPKRFKHLRSMEAFTDWVADWGVSRPVILTPMFFALVLATSFFVPRFLLLSFSWLIFTFPIWAPVAVAIGWWRVWVWYVRALYIGKKKNVVLDVKFPREVMKSPRAMETALTSFWTTAGETTFIDRFWTGSMRAWYSLEIVSHGGDVHFYIWCWQDYRAFIESNLYAQYPEIEINEVEDYATKFHYDEKEYDMFSNHMIFETDPDGVLPIRTYIDYELDKDPKEEHKVDPMAQIVELLSTARGSEEIWVQIIFTAMGFKESPGFQKKAHERVEKIRLEASVRPKDPEHPSPEEEGKLGFPHPTWKQTEQVRAIERHMGKRMFLVGIRICYMAKLSDYRSSIRNAVRWIFLPYNSQWLNRLRPKRWHGDLDYPWQDYKGIRWRLIARRFLDAYRRRSYFYAPWISPPLNMSVESIASLWHPPGSTIASPGLQRIPAKKAPPPPNLPTK